MKVLYEFSRKKMMKKCMMAATFVCGTTMVLSSCSSKDDNPLPTEPETEQDVMNKKITDGNYDHSLAVKCVNVGAEDC